MSVALRAMEAHPSLPPCTHFLPATLDTCYQKKQPSSHTIPMVPLETLPLETFLYPEAAHPVHICVL